MVNGINHITFSVSDLEVSLRFYIDLLGLKLVRAWDEGAYLLAGNQWIALNVETRSTQCDHSTYSHIAFNVSFADFQETRDRLVDAGVISFKENTSEGSSFYFLDPDGHKLELHFNTLEDRLKWFNENQI